MHWRYCESSIQLRPFLVACFVACIICLGWVTSCIWHTFVYIYIYICIRSLIWYHIYRDVFAERHRLQSQVFQHGIIVERCFAEHTGKISQMKKVGTTLPFLVSYWNNQWLFRKIEDTDRVKVVQNIRKLCPTPPVWDYPVWPLRHRLPCPCPSNIIGGKVVRGS